VRHPRRDVTLIPSSFTAAERGPNDVTFVIPRLRCAETDRERVPDRYPPDYARVHARESLGLCIVKTASRVAKLPHPKINERFGSVCSCSESERCNRGSLFSWSESIHFLDRFIINGRIDLFPFSQDATLRLPCYVRRILPARRLSGARHSPSNHCFPPTLPRTQSITGKVEAPVIGGSADKSNFKKSRTGRRPVSHRDKIIYWRRIAMDRISPS